MYNNMMVKITAGPNDAHRRLDRFLRQYFDKAPLSLIYKMIRKDVKVNGKRQSRETLLEEGDEICVYMTEEQADAAKGSGRDIEGVQAHQEMETDFRAPAEQAVRDPHEDCRDEAVERRIDEPADQPRIEIRKEPVRAVVLNDAQRAGVRLLSSALQPLSEAVTGDGRIGVDRVDQLQEDPGSCRLKEIAAGNNYNYYYFSGLFKKRTGYNFTQLKRDQQLHKAKELLSSTDMNIDDIGRRCGFSNLTLFYKNFQKKYKMTPKEYRDSI